jgi:hypothetical protein
MSLLIIAALLYLGLALGLVLVIDNMVGLFFRETRAPHHLRFFIVSKALAASQRLYRK